MGIGKNIVSFYLLPCYARDGLWHFLLPQLHTVNKRYHHHKPPAWWLHSDVVLDWMWKGSENSIFLSVVHYLALFPLVLLSRGQSLKSTFWANTSLFPLAFLPASLLSMSRAFIPLILLSIFDTVCWLVSCRDWMDSVFRVFHELFISYVLLQGDLVGFGVILKFHSVHPAPAIWGKHHQHNFFSIPFQYTKQLQSFC